MDFIKAKPSSAPFVSLSWGYWLHWHTVDPQGTADVWPSTCITRRGICDKIAQLRAFRIASTVKIETKKAQEGL
jgi:hypothetical protein